MFLSNRHAAALSFALAIFAAAGCAGSQAPISQPATVTPLPSTIPFETKEPATYQADFFTIPAGAETRSHIATKDGRWRFDSFDGERPNRSIIRTEKLIHLDHASKTYSEAPTGGDSPPSFVTDLTASLLTQKPPAKFEKIGTEGTQEKYRVTADGSATPSIITYDTAIKMVTRHEIGDGFAFEMGNFNLEVNDAMFQVPPGYRKMPWTEFVKK